MEEVEPTLRPINDNGSNNGNNNANGNSLAIKDTVGIILMALISLLLLLALLRSQRQTRAALEQQLAALQK